MGKELDTAIRNEVKRITGLTKPDTIGAMATGDLDLMKQRNTEWSNMVKSDPRIKTIIDTETFKMAVKWNKKPERVGQKLWLDPTTGKEYNKEEGVKRRDAWNNSEQAKANPDLAAAPNPQKASGLRLSGGMGCCKTGRCKMCKLVGGSRSSGYIKKLIAQEKFDLAKMKVEPSAHLKKKYSVAQPQPKKRGRKPKQAKAPEAQEDLAQLEAELNNLGVANRTRSKILKDVKKDIVGSGLKLSGSGKKTSNWIDYVKKCQEENGCSYKEALQRAKSTYNK